MTETATQLAEQPAAELTVPETVTALEVFSAPEGLDPYIEQARQFVSEQEPDTSTDKGRKAIASTAHKVARLKTRLDAMGKDLVSDWKARAKAVDSSRKSMRDQLDELRDQARAPLDEWEQADKERKAELDANYKALEDMVASVPLFSKRESLANATALHDEHAALDYQEYQSGAEMLLRLLSDAIEAKTAAFDAADEEERRLEAQRLEQARVEKEQRAEAERLEKEREQLRLEKQQAEDAKAEAAEKVRLAQEAEARAKADAEAAKQREAERIENERLTPIKQRIDMIKGIIDIVPTLNSESIRKIQNGPAFNEQFNYQEFSETALNAIDTLKKEIDKRIIELDGLDKQIAVEEKAAAEAEAAQIQKRKVELEQCCIETFEALRPFCKSKKATEDLVDALTVGAIPHVSSLLIE